MLTGRNACLYSVLLNTQLLLSSGRVAPAAWAGGIPGLDGASPLNNGQMSSLPCRQTKLLRLPVLQFPNSFLHLILSFCIFSNTPQNLNSLEMSPGVQEMNALQTIYDAFLRKSDLASIPWGPFFSLPLFCSAAKRTF